MNNRVCHFKLVLLGDAAVGKSCLVVRFVRDEFFEFQEPTIGGKNIIAREGGRKEASKQSGAKSQSFFVESTVMIDRGSEKN